MVRISLSHLTVPGSIPQLAALGFLVSLGGATPAQAQKAADTWKPEGNVEFVVGAGAGGENDRIARAIAHALGNEHLVDSMTVLNRPGAAQTIAMQYLASKKGDASAIGLASGSFINAIARSGSGLHKNLIPLMKLFDAYQCYFTRADSPIKTMVDVRERLRANPRSLTFAFPVGLGTPLHVSVVSVGKAAGAAPNELITVVYNSGSDVAAQIAGGHVDIGITSIGSAMPLIAAGRLRMLGIASPERIGGVLAEFPTVREQGLDVVTPNSYTVLAPNGLAPGQIDFWTRALDKVLLDSEFKLDLERNFWVLEPIRYPETVKWLQDDYDENRIVLKELGMAQ
jgi:putative tricarboxylic transport membrane protein